MKVIPFRATLILLLLGSGAGCFRAQAPAGVVVVTAAEVQWPLPAFETGAAATATSTGFLVLPAPRSGGSNQRVLRPVEDPAAPRRGAVYRSDRDLWLELPGEVPEAAFLGAAPFGDGALALTSFGGWVVDLEEGTWTALEGGPLGNFVIEDHAARAGGVLLFGHVPNGSCAAWELREAAGVPAWRPLPAPPCSSFWRSAMVGDRWFLFAWDYVNERWDAASLGPADDAWRTVATEGIPSALGLVVGDHGWLAAIGTRTAPFLWVNASVGEGLFLFDGQRWELIDSDARRCGWYAPQARGELLLSIGEEGQGCAWDVAKRRRLEDFKAPKFDRYVPGTTATLGWGRTTRYQGDREQVVVPSAAAALLRLDVRR